MEGIKETYENIYNVAADAVVNMWRLQGHELTGRAVREMRMQVIETASGIDINGLVLDYMARVNEGTPADKIIVNSRYVSELTDYVIRRGIESGRKEAESIAYRIASRHGKEGNPTIASKRFSKTGKRTGFIEDGLEGAKSEIEEATRRAFAIIIESRIETFFKTKLNR